MNNKMREYDIFISYRRSDGFAVAEVFQLELEKRGYSVFFDKKNLHSGPFPKEIETAIKQANEFIAIVSHDYFEAKNGDYYRIQSEEDWIKKEFELAIKEEKNIFPILIDATVPDASILPKSLKGILELQFKKYDKNIDTVDKLIDSINDGFDTETTENAIVGAIRNSIRDIDVTDRIFNERCKALINLVENNNIEAIVHILEEKDKYDVKNRYAAFYVLFSYFRRLQDVNRLIELIEKWGEEFSEINVFYFYVMVEYCLLKFQLANDISEERMYLLKMLGYSELAKNNANDNNGMVHSYCLSVAMCLENGIEIDDGKKRIALDEINKIIKKAPDYAIYYSTKARLLAQDDNYEEALLNNRKAQALETPKHDDWQKRMATYYKEECLIKMMQLEYKILKDRI